MIRGGDGRSVMVAMSGGVDSSVAALVLRDAGHDVTGVTLRLWGGESDSGCCSVADVEDARRVAAQLGIPHYVLNLADEFGRDVVDEYVAAHGRGETPNPCVECNRSIKFGALVARADALGFDAVATGHHARIVPAPGGGLRLGRGVDAAKDQSYVLYMLGQAELRRTLLPVGELTKVEVRALAATHGLRTAVKPESMDVCFITRGGRRRFLDERLAPRPGPVVDADGTVLGTHAGVAHVTIGQRRGLRVAAGERRYVVAVDAATATVTVGPRPELLRDEIPLRDVSWAAEPVPLGTPLDAQVRAHGDPLACELGDDRVHLRASAPRVAPGQVVALYDGDTLVGGGIAA